MRKALKNSMCFWGRERERERQREKHRLWTPGPARAEQSPKMKREREVYPIEEEDRCSMCIYIYHERYSIEAYSFTWVSVVSKDSGLAFKLF